MNAFVGERMVLIPDSRPDLFGVLSKNIGPRPIHTVSQWADQNRVLSSKGSGEAGRWRTDRTPYLREIMDCLSIRSPVERVVVKFAAQTGKTELGLNWIGYVIDQAQAPMLVVVPTLEVRKRWVKQRLDPLLGETPALRKVFGSQRTRDAANAEDMKDFPGGILVIGGANSAASLASMPIKYVLCDEVDRFPWELAHEGDPLGLIDERTKTFPRRKVLLTSSPTTKGASRIDQEYEASDQREYQVPCPSCGAYQPLRWKRADGTYGLTHNKATGEVFYSCEHCGDRIDEHHKTAMLAAGKWVARHPERSVRGYWISGLYSPIGLGFSWAELWQKWQQAHGDSANLKRFINTDLGESWEEQGDSIEDLALIARLEDYPEKLPILLSTAGVDVQKDRLEVSIAGWAAEEECYLIDHVILPGDTADLAVWSDLEALLRDEAIDFAAIDSGYNTSFVYAFCRARSWCFATKGIAGMGRPLVEDEVRRRQRLRRRTKHGIQVEPIGVDQGKALLLARLKMQVSGPGFVHFPRKASFDDEYFAQLAAEKLVTKYRGMRPIQEWVSTRPRNEALDCLLLCLVAQRLSGRSLVKAAAQPAASTPPDTQSNQAQKQHFPARHAAQKGTRTW